MGLNQRLSRALFGICMATWAFSMVFLGLLMLVDWPGRVLNFPMWMCVLFGALLIATGEFVFAITAARMFPAASPRLTGAMELLPIIGFAAVLMGVLFYRGN